MIRHLGTVLDRFSHILGGVIAIGINATVLRGVGDGGGRHLKYTDHLLLFFDLQGMAPG